MGRTAWDEDSVPNLQTFTQMGSFCLFICPGSVRTIHDTRALPILASLLSPRATSRDAALASSEFSQHCSRLERILATLLSCRVHSRDAAVISSAFSRRCCHLERILATLLSLLATLLGSLLCASILSGFWPVAFLGLLSCCFSWPQSCLCSRPSDLMRPRPSDLSRTVTFFSFVFGLRSFRQGLYLPENPPALSKTCVCLVSLTRCCCPSD